MDHHTRARLYAHVYVLFWPWLWWQLLRLGHWLDQTGPPESVFDFVQSITAVARSKPQQDARLTMNTRAKKLLEAAR